MIAGDGDHRVQLLQISDISQKLSFKWIFASSKIKLETRIDLNDLRLPF